MRVGPLPPERKDALARMHNQIAEILNATRVDNGLIGAHTICDNLGLTDLHDRSNVSRVLASLTKRGILKDTTPEKTRFKEYKVLRRVPLHGVPERPTAAREKLHELATREPATRPTAGALLDQLLAEARAGNGSAETNARLARLELMVDRQGQMLAWIYNELKGPGI